MRFICGRNMHDFYLIPTIRISRHCEMQFVTIEWLKLYIGFSMEVKVR